MRRRIGRNSYVVPAIGGAMSTTYFDAVATRWETMREDFFSPRVREKAVAAADLTHGARALDVGAGSGFLTEALLAAGARVDAVDASARMVDEIRRRHGVEARVADAERLPYADAAFDAALANMCLHHVERPAVALREMARVLRPGGRVVVTDLDAHTHEFLRAEHHDRWMGFERADVVKWLRDAGLVDVEVVDATERCCATSACGTKKADVTIFLATGRKP